MFPIPPLHELRTELQHTWKIAWPLFIAQLAQMGTGVVDTIMAGRYDDQDLAAIAVGYNIWLPAYLLVLGVLFANSSIVAQDFGAQRLSKIRAQLPQSLWVAVALGLLVGPLVWFSSPLMSLLELNAATHDKALAYTRMVALGIPAVGIFLSLRFHTQGLGITKPFAVASVIGFLANIPLNVAFIYGLWGAPELGAEGCGIATAISMWLSLALILGYVVYDKNLKPYLPEWRPTAPDWTIIREILVLGIPIGLTFFLEIGVFSLIAARCHARRHGHGIASDRLQYLGPVLHTYAGFRYRYVDAHGACHRRGRCEWYLSRALGELSRSDGSRARDNASAANRSRAHHSDLHRIARNSGTRDAPDTSSGIFYSHRRGTNHRLIRPTCI